MDQAGFPQKWIEQGYAELEGNFSQKSDKTDLYLSYCIQNRLPYFMQVTWGWGGEAQIYAIITTRDKCLSSVGQEQIKELLAKHDTWTFGKEWFHWSYISAVMIHQRHLPQESLPELIPQVIALILQHLEAT